MCTSERFFIVMQKQEQEPRGWFNMGAFWKWCSGCIRVEVKKCVGRDLYLTRVLLLVDDGQRVLRSLPLSLGHGALHFGALGADHVMSLAFGFGHGLLQLGHGLPLHLVHCLF